MGKGIGKSIQGVKSVQGVMNNAPTVNMGLQIGRILLGELQDKATEVEHRTC